MSRVSHLAGQRYFVCVGDSKSVSGTYQSPLITYLEGRTGQRWTTALVHARAGWTASSAEEGLADALAGIDETVEYVFINLGTNETTAMPLEAAFKDDYASILDQCHTKWPDAGIYVAHIYRASQTANSATVNGWIDDVIADGRSAWATVAFDEADWLPDWTLDGTHPDVRIGGYSEMARQWFAALAL